jgi:hypothetical protein
LAGTAPGDDIEIDSQCGTVGGFRLDESSTCVGFFLNDGKPEIGQRDLGGSNRVAE